MEDYNFFHLKQAITLTAMLFKISSKFFLNKMGPPKDLSEILTSSLSKESLENVHKLKQATSHITYIYFLNFHQLKRATPLGRHVFQDINMI